MEFPEAKQKVHEFLEGVRRYKRWHYRRPVLENLVVLFRQEGVKVEVGEGSVSLKREMAYGETYQVVFRQDGTIRCEVHDPNGPLTMVDGSIEDFLVEVLTGAVLVKS